MARKSLQEMSGIANTIARSGTKTKDGTRSSAPALGALQGSLTAIRELETDLVDDWGPLDRLDEFTAVNEPEDETGFDSLVESIREGGQHVPILVRRSTVEGRYEAIYGRRRLRACRKLGIKVKANVQNLDDQTALLAKGLENAARRNLSFYERARFAQAIQEAGHDSKTVRQVLNVSAPGLSHLTKVTENVPRAVGDSIGPAPKGGRPKWTGLAEAFADKKITSTSALAFLKKLDENVGSDARLDALLQEIAKRGTRPRDVIETEPVDGVVIKSGRGSVAVSIKKTGTNAGFAEWLEGQLPDLLQASFEEFTAVNSDKEK